MILLLAIITGLVAGVVRTKYGGHAYAVPEFKLGWLLIIAVIPQLFIFHLPITSSIFSDNLAAIFLVSTQIFLLIFVWQNRKLSGLWILGIGLLMNLGVIALNGGLMPISLKTLHRLQPDAVIESLDIGTRMGSSKDKLVVTSFTKLWFLSDRFVVPDWIPYRVAFSLGDIFIAMGVFWLLWTHGNIDAEKLGHDISK